MIILDAILAGLVIKFFGEQGVMVVICMAAIALMRIGIRAERHFNLCENVIYFLSEEDDDEEEQENI